ncbi:MAG: aspartate/glutamate racemase family protein [Kiloniellaceae bacterium]
MTKRVRLGMLTPSSNTVLEPVTAAMVAGLPEVSAHFARFRVTEISLSDPALRQFDTAPLIAAAKLLADARVDVMAWNGTSAGWLGFEADAALCRLVTRETGVPATSSVRALNEVFATTGVTRFGLVTPYLGAIQERIIANYARAGITCVAEQHLDDPGNFSFSEVSERRIAGMVRAVAAAGPQAITTFCTNLRGASIVDALERELGIPIYDTVAAAVWKSLKMAGVDTRRVQGWGRLFNAAGEISKQRQNA